MQGSRSVTRRNAFPLDLDRFQGLEGGLGGYNCQFLVELGGAFFSFRAPTLGGSLGLLAAIPKLNILIDP